MKDWLGHLNFFLLQWFFVRLMKVIDGPTGRESWHLSGFYVPMTGWEFREVRPDVKKGHGMRRIGKRWWLPRVKP